MPEAGWPQTPGESEPSAVRPIRTPRSNTTYTLPDHGHEGDLPAERIVLQWAVKGLGLVAGPGNYRVPGLGELRAATPYRSAIRSAWLLTDDEVLQITQTGLLELTIWGEPIPPVALAVIEPGDHVDYGWGPGKPPPEPPIDREHANIAIGALYTQLGDHCADVTPDQFLALWHEALAMTSYGAAVPDDPDARPSEDHRDPRDG